MIGITQIYAPEVDAPKHSESTIQIIFREMSGNILGTQTQMISDTIFNVKKEFIDKYPDYKPNLMIEGKTDILSEELVLGDLITRESNKLILSTVLVPVTIDMRSAPGQCGSWIEEKLPYLRDCSIAMSIFKNLYPGLRIDLLEVRVCGCDDSGEHKEILFSKHYNKRVHSDSADEVQKWVNKKGNVVLDQFIMHRYGPIVMRVPVRTVMIMTFEEFIDVLYKGEMHATKTISSGDSNQSIDIVAPRSLPGFFKLIEAEFARTDKPE